MRIVSLLPSATEILSLIGAEASIVGRSHECDHPATLADRPILTSATTDYNTTPDASIIDAQVRSQLNHHTSKADPEAAADHADAQDDRSLYKLDHDQLRSLRPDIIVTQDLCSVCSIDLNTVRRIARDMDPRPSIVSLNPTSFEAVLDDVLAVGEAIGHAPQARAAVGALRDRFFRAADFVTPYQEQPSVLFLEWSDPPFSGGHWVPQLIERAGGVHPLNPTYPLEGAGAGAGGQQAHRAAGPSTQVTPEQIGAHRFDRVIVCPCGLTLEQSLAETHKLMRQEWFASLDAVARDQVAVLDGNQMFARPGPRLVDAYEWLVGWLNDRPELIPAGFPWMQFPAGAGTA